MGRFLVLFCFFSYLSCTNRNGQLVNENDGGGSILTKDTIRYEIFSVENGYGFNILKNERIYIHQPIIPTWPGLQPFHSEKAAEAIASLITLKLQSQNFRFLLEKMEVDSFMTEFPVPGINLENIKAKQVARGSIYVMLKQTEKNSVSLFAGFPVLSTPPLKRRWHSKGIVPFGYRGGTLSFAIGNSIYIGAGESKDQTTNDFWCYNTITEAWTCLAETPGGVRISGVSFAIDGKGYLGLGGTRGGISKSYKNDFYEYDSRQNKWSRKSNFPGTPRVDAASFTINDLGYAGLGFDESYRNDMYQYNPVSDTWSRIADFGGGGVSASIGISTGTKGFIVAGDRVPNNQKFVYEYDPLINEWMKRKDLPGNPRYFLSGYAIDTSLFIAGCGGADGGEKRFRDFYIYNSTKDEWSQIADYPVSKAGNSRPSGGSVNGKIYMGTGYNGSFLNDWNVFEYYFSVRKDTGVYNESVCYPIQYDGNWQLYEECTKDDCFAGAALRTNESLGDFCYGSRLVNNIRTVSLNDDKQSEKIFLFPRNYSIQTTRQPDKQVSLRLFFSRLELEKTLQDCQSKTGIIYSTNNIQILKCNERTPDTEFSNNSFKDASCDFITPQWYSYGVNADIIVAEFSVSSLHSEFYLALTRK